MLLLGLIAITQISLLPGLIILQLLDIRGFLLKSVLAFAFSLTLNFQLVFFLTLTGAYTRSAMAIALGFEVLVLGWLYVRRHSFKDRITITLFSTRMAAYPFLFRLMRYFLLAAASCAFVAVLLSLLKENLWVFHILDDVMSWNRWATEWFTGHLPSRTSEYPQLLPANWSTTYLFIRSAYVQVFSKAVVALFPLAALLILYDEYRRFSSVAALAAIVFCAYLFLKLLGPIGSGYADIPVTFFALLTFYLIHLHFRDVIGLRDTMVSVALTASGAALTKQAGLFVLIIALILLLRAALKQRPVPAVRRKRLLPFIYVIAVISLLVLPWYAMKENEIRRGIDQSNVRYVTSGIYSEKNPAKRIMAVSLNIANRTGLPREFLLLFFMLLMISLKTPVGRRSLFLIAIPYYLLWAALFSYDNRNLALSLPFFSIAAGEGLSYILGLIRPVTSEDRSASNPVTLDLPLCPSIGVLFSFVLILAVIGSIWYPASALVNKTDEMRRKVGDPLFNQKLYEFYHSHGFAGKVVSDGEMCVLPEIGQYCYTGGFKSADDIPNFEKDDIDICETLKRVTAGDEIRYMIVSDGDVLSTNIIDSALKRGTLVRIFSASGKSFLEVKCPR